jgi:hypothetical protein
LVTSVKGQAPDDQHKRVILEVDKNGLEVRAYGSDSGVTVPCETVGEGIRGVNAEYLTEIMAGVDSKEVTFKWGKGAPAIRIDAPGYEDCTTLLAPLASV